MRKSATPVSQRFNQFVKKTESCWLWVGTIDRSTGYGALGVKRADGKWRKKLAHRISYEMFVGRIQDGLEIDHLCRVRACVNPAHLEAVTPRTNVLRGESPSARAARRTTCSNGHDYTADNTRIVDGARQCVACQRSWQERHRRALGKPLGNKFKTHCKHGHKFTPENTYVFANGRRKCRTCRRLGMAKQIENAQPQSQPTQEAVAQ